MTLRPYLLFTEVSNATVLHPTSPELTVHLFRIKSYFCLSIYTAHTKTCGRSNYAPFLLKVHHAEISRKENLYVCIRFILVLLKYAGSRSFDIRSKVQFRFHVNRRHVTHLFKIHTKTIKMSKVSYTQIHPMFVRQNMMTKRVSFVFCIPLRISF